MSFDIFEFLTHERIIFFAILSCGVYTGYTDFRHGKISNIYVLFLVGFGTISQILFISEGSITVLHSCAIFGGGLGLSFMMFYLGIWAAGDAKLFWGISLLMPPSSFIRSSETLFYPLILLVNIFILFLVYVIFTSILKIPLRQQRALIFKSFMAQLKQFPLRIPRVLAYIGIGGLAFYIPSRLEVRLDMVVQITLFLAIVFAFNKIVEKRIPQKYKFAFYIPFISLAIFFAIPSLLQLGSFIVFIFLLPWFLLMFGSFVQLVFTKEVPIDNLHPNMIPAERIVKIEEEGVADRYTKIVAGFANPLQDGVVADVSSEGLRREQITNLRQLAATGCLEEFGNSLLIQKKIPFAHIIVLGALVTLFSRGLVYSVIKGVELNQILEKLKLLFY